MYMQTPFPKVMHRNMVNRHRAVSCSLTTHVRLEGALCFSPASVRHDTQTGCGDLPDMPVFAPLLCHWVSILPTEVLPQSLRMGATTVFYDCCIVAEIGTSNRPSIRTFPGLESLLVYPSSAQGCLSYAKKTAFCLFVLWLF